MHIFLSPTPYHRLSQKTVSYLFQQSCNVRCNLIELLRINDQIRCQVIKSVKHENVFVIFIVVCVEKNAFKVVECDH